MAGLGLIATGAAFLNFRKAKAEYEEALLDDNTEAILAAVSQYNSSKYDQLDQYDKDEFKPKETDLFTVVPVINAGMMVGKYCRIQGVCLLVNNTDLILDLAELKFRLKLYGQDTLLYQYQGKKIRIGAKESKEIKWVPNVSHSQGAHINFDLFEDEIIESLSDMYPKTDALRQAEAAVIRANQRGSHQFPIGLCQPNTVIIGTPPCVTADCLIKYDGGDIAGIEEKKNVPGSFCYKGEAFYPYNDK